MHKRKCCRNCHFLAKASRSPTDGTSFRFSWNEGERSDPSSLSDHYAAECAQGVWDTGIDPSLKAQLPDILRKRRWGSCFFIRVQQGMSFPAAEKLLKLQKMRRSYWYAGVALLISFGSLLTSMFFGFMGRASGN